MSDSDRLGLHEVGGKNRINKLKFFALFAVAIMVITGFSVVVKGETVITVSSLPYEEDPIKNTTATFEMDCLNGPTEILVRIWNVSSDTKLNMSNQGEYSIKAGIENIFIITALPNSTLGFDSAENAAIRIEKIEKPRISSRDNAKISAKTFYKLNSRAYIADIAPALAGRHNITLTPDEDLAYFTITDGAISRYTTVTAGSEMAVTLGENSSIRLLSQHPVNFNLTLENISSEVSTGHFITGITAYAWLDIKPHSSLAKRWYPALGALDDAFGIISIAVCGTTLASDVNGFLRT